jgi:parvulin-like peptidyl-prolyl isomerase
MNYEEQQMKKQILALVLIAFSAMCGITWAQQTTLVHVPPKPDITEKTDLVVLKISGEPVTETEVVIAIDQLASQPFVSPDQRRQRYTLLFNGAVENIISTVLLKNQARKQNVVVDPSKIDEQFKKISSGYPSPEAFQKVLVAQGTSEAELRKAIEGSFSMQVVLDEVYKTAPAVTSEEITKFYDGNPDKFVIPEQVHASHVLLKTENIIIPEQKAEIKKKLEGILADIQSNKITFADAAVKYSQDTTNAAKGGDLDFFARGSMVAPFEEAAFSTPPGSISPVVETRFGYHIINVIERKPAGKMLLDEVKPKIQQYLTMVNNQKVAQKLVDDLKAQAQIEQFMTIDEFGKRHPMK